MKNLQVIESKNLTELLDPSKDDNQLSDSVEKSLAQFMGKSDLFDLSSYHNIGLENGKLLEDESIYIEVIAQRFEALNNYYDSHNHLVDNKLHSINIFRKKFLNEKESLVSALDFENPESYFSKINSKIEKAKATLSDFEREYAIVKSGKLELFFKISIFISLFVLINWGVVEIILLNKIFFGNDYQFAHLIFSISFSISTSFLIYIMLTTNAKIQRSISFVAVISLLLSVLSLALSNSSIIQSLDPTIDFLIYNAVFLTLSPLGLSSIAGILLYYIFQSIREYSSLLGKSVSLGKDIFEKEGDINELNGQIESLKNSLENIERNINIVDSSYFQTQKLKLPSVSFIQNLKSSSINSYLAGYNKGKAQLVLDKVINIKKVTFDAFKSKSIDRLYATEKKKMTIEVLDNTSVSELQSLFLDLDNAYKKLYVLYSIDNIYAAYLKGEEVGLTIPEKKEINSFVRFLSVAEELLIKKSDELALQKISISSPGIIEVLGKLNPLEQIRTYLNDRHERKKDNNYRNESQKKKLEIENDRLEKENEIMLERKRIENQMLRDEMLMKRIEFINSSEIAEEKKTELIENYFIEPLMNLAIYQKRQLISTIELSDLQVEK